MAILNWIINWNSICFMKNNGHHCYEGTSIKSNVSFSLVWFCMLRSETQNWKLALITLIKTTDYLHERWQKLQMNTDNKWSLSSGYGNIQNLKETGSIHLYICNSKGHLVKSGCRWSTNSCFVHARFCIISAFKQTNLLFN